jgi:hypothetical protein
MVVKKAPKTLLTAAAVKREVTAMRDPARAKFLQGFFRTGAGEYGEGDKMLGLSVPDQRVIAKAFRALPLDQTAKLLESEFHEHRLIGLLILVDQHARADEAGKLVLHRFYLEKLGRVNNWDLVDTSAAELMGEHLHSDGKLLRAGKVVEPLGASRGHRQHLCRVARRAYCVDLRGRRASPPGQTRSDPQSRRMAPARGGEAGSASAACIPAHALRATAAHDVALRDRTAGAAGAQGLACATKVRITR